MNTTFFAAAVVAGTPLLFATLGETMTEKSGHLNLGVEGMMLIGAVAGFSVGLATGNPFMALLGAGLAGALGAFIYAFLTVSLRANQVVTGLALTILGTGVSSFIGKSYVGKVMPETIKAFFGKAPIPLLSKIPFFGDIFFNQDVFVYLGYITAILLGLYMYKTQTGLHLRAVGESPASADAAGISINLYKYVHILLGGALCGLGGAYLSLVYVPTWQENITAGRGWIAIALVIFCGWNPYKAMLGAMLFGGLDILGFRIQGWGIHVPQHFIDMLPYLATIFVMVLSSMGKSKKNKVPGALGEAYFREER